MPRRAPLHRLLDTGEFHRAILDLDGSCNIRLRELREAAFRQSAAPHLPELAGADWLVPDGNIQTLKEVRVLKKGAQPRASSVTLHLLEEPFSAAKRQSAS